MQISEIIARTVFVLEKLPLQKAEEISDFADYLYTKYEEELNGAEITQLQAKGGAFDFLEDDDIIYTVNDVKIR